MYIYIYLRWQLIGQCKRDVIAEFAGLGTVICVLAQWVPVIAATHCKVDSTLNLQV